MKGGNHLAFTHGSQANEVKIKIYSEKFVENLSHDKSTVGLLGS